MKHCSGFILFMTLCLISVVSLLLLTGMQHVLLYSKVINKQEMQQQLFYQLEQVAMQLAQAKPLATEMHCMRDVDSVNLVRRQLIHGKGCSLVVGESTYRYIIEDLGVFSCLKVHYNGTVKATQHLRISILHQNQDRNVAMMQIRVIKPINDVSCTSETHTIKAGISSWRYFIDIFE